MSYPFFLARVARWRRHCCVDAFWNCSLIPRSLENIQQDTCRRDCSLFVWLYNSVSQIWENLCWEFAKVGMSGNIRNKNTVA